MKLKKALLTAAAVANRFRMEAAADIDAAVKNWGDPAFAIKWRKDVMSLFGDKEKIEWHDFFSSAVLWVGRVTEKEAVAAFYNPWMDGLLLAVAKLDGKSSRLTDFCLVSGESWRRQPPAGPEDVLALYEGREILTIALAKLYAGTIAVFNKHYPLEAETALLPPAAENLPGKPGEEVALIKARMLARMSMYKKLFSPPNRHVVDAAGGLIKRIKAGDAKQLKAYLADPAMADAVCALPFQVRGDMGPNYFARSERGAIVALVNAEAPRWFVVAQILGKAGAKQAIGIEVFDLEGSAELVRLAGEAE
jgi:hypothetical protein